MPAGRVFKDLSPLDSAGLADHRPEREVKWTKLQNVVFKEGGIARRPGLRFPTWYSGGQIHDTDLPSVERGYPVAIMEITNPGDTATGREGFAWITETILPDSNTQLVAGWSNDYTEIDETPPDGVAWMSSSTDGAQEIIGFGNVSEDFDAVSHLVIRGRACTTGPAEPQTLNIYARVSSTNYLIGSIIIWGGPDGTLPE